MIEIPGILDRICNEVKAKLNESDENFNLVITGIPGKGKSGSALEFAKRIDPNFTAEKVVFTPEHFMDILDSPLAKPGSVIMFDEAGCGRSAYESQKKMAVAMNKVLQSHRYLNLCVIYTASFMSFILKNDRKLAHANYKIFSRENSPKRVIGKWYDLKWSESMGTNLTIFKKYRVKGVPVTIRELAVPHPPLKLWKDYKKKEAPFKKSVRDDARQIIELARDPQLLNRKRRVESMQKVKKLVEVAKQSKEKYKGKRGAYNVDKLAVDLGVGKKRAQKVKAALELEDINENN